MLADAVYGEIFVAALFGGSRLPPEPRRGTVLNCDQTAASVSAGFARAMAALEVYVGWHAPSSRTGAICTSGDIALCIPLTNQTVSSGALDEASIAELWQLVAGVVARSMPLGTMSDRSTFHEYELRLRLNDALVNRYWNVYGWSRSMHQSR